LLIYATHRESVVDIHAASPAYRDLAASISTNGKVTPINGFQARAAIAGMVEKIYVKVGEKVRPGQMLVQIRDPFAESRYTGAVAALQSAIVADQNIRQGGSQEERINVNGDLKHAVTEQADAANRLELLKTLHQKGDASDAEVSDAERRLKEADATLETVRQRSAERYSPKDIASSAARVADARANLETAKQVLANANITSSIAGTVYSIPVSTYDFVPMGADILMVADLDAVQIRAYVDEPDIGQLRAGQPVDVFWDAKPGVS
jgi:HlyD family secretion protein